MFSLNFNNVLSEKGITSTALAEFITNRGRKISKESIAKYRNGSRTPDPEIISFAAQMAQVDEQSFFGKMKYSSVSNNTDYVDIPIVNVNAGAGSLGIYPDFIDKTEKIPIASKFLDGVNTKFLSIMKVSGDSMHPTIKDKDWLIVDMVSDGNTDRVYEKVSGIYVIAKDGGIQVKRLEFKGSRGIDIISDNTIYSKENTITDNIEIFIIGKVFKHISDLGSLVISNLSE